MTAEHASIPAAVADALAAMPDPLAGTQVSRYEDELARHFGVPCAVAVASGTAALHCALAACQIGPGDEVLVPALSVVMSAAPVTYTGARPVFIDCDPSGTGLCYDDLAAKTTPRSKAIIPVHLWGRAGNPARLAAFAASRGLRVIEDACQAHGTRSGGRMAGTSGDLGCFSTKDGKLLWSGEGGFILTSDTVLAEHCRAFRTHWQTPPPGQPPLSQAGWNYRLASRWPPSPAPTSPGSTSSSRCGSTRPACYRTCSPAHPESMSCLASLAGTTTRRWLAWPSPIRGGSASTWPHSASPTAPAPTA